MDLSSLEAKIGRIDGVLQSVPFLLCLAFLLSKLRLYVVKGPAMEAYIDVDDNDHYQTVAFSWS